MTTSASEGTLEDLTAYVRPSVAVDTAVLTVPPPDSGRASQLHVLVIRRTGGHRSDHWSLPGTFLHEGEVLADAVLRSLKDKAHVEGLAPRQLRVFDALGRDDRGWVLSVAHLDVVPWRRLRQIDGHADVALMPCGQAKPLPFDHEAIVELAVAQVREDYLAGPDPAQLLDEPFTLLQLRQLHEAVAGRPMARDTFRRRMEPELLDTGAMSSGRVGKPARLFRRAD